jgi:Flp pilus assembly protein TadD
MKTIELRHDQVQKTTTVHDDGEAIYLNCLGTGAGHSLLDWKDKLFPELVKQCRLGPGRGAELVFWGMADDFKHIEAALEDFIGQNDIEIQISYKGEIPVPVASILKCRKCGFELKPNWIKCPKCKTPVVEETLKCECGEELEDWMDECPACGKAVVRKAPAETQQTAAQPAASGDSAEDHKRRADEFTEKKDYDNAIKELTEAIKLDSDNAEHYGYRGNVYCEKADYAAGLNDFIKAIEIDSGNAEYYNNRGDVYYIQENYAAAIKDYTKAIELDPDNAVDYNHRGNAYRCQENYAAAIKDATKAIELAPDNADYYCNRGHAFFALGNKTAAKADYRMALSIDPGYDRTRFLIKNI